MLLGVCPVKGVKAADRWVLGFSFVTVISVPQLHRNHNTQLSVLDQVSALTILDTLVRGHENVQLGGLTKKAWGP